MKHTTMLVLALCLAAAATALGVFSYRMAARESDYRRNEAKKLLEAQCLQRARECRDLIRGEILDLIRFLKDAPCNVDSLDQLGFRNPLISGVFLIDRDGGTTYPSNPETLLRDYRSLFFEKIKPVATQSENDSGPLESGGEEDERMITEFQRLTAGRPDGWIPWYTRNRFLPVVWTETSSDPKRLVGARVETVALLSRLVPLFNLPVDGVFHLELNDANTGVVCESGFPLDRSAAEPAVLVPIDPEFAPGWQIRGFIEPGHVSDSPRLWLANILLISLLLLVIGGAAALIFHLARREMIVAGKKTTFVANVSHELKTPLTSIRMYSEMLLQGGEKIDGEKRRRYLGVVIAESERLSRLISNVLDFSKLEAGEKKYHPRRLPLGALLQELKTQIETMLTGTGIDLSMSVPDEELVADIDRDSLIQVIQNLVANVAKYAADGGELIIQLKSLPREQASIDILDRGPGIPKGLERKIFQKFYRVDDRLTAETRGSGLGLTISRGMMRDQGGDLRHAPRPGGGAIFSIILRICHHE